MAVVFLDDLDAPLVSFPWSYEAGLETDLQVKIFNEGPGDARPYLFVIQTENPTAPGRWESATTPPQIEQWLSASVTGSDNTNVITTPGWVADLTEFVRMGAGGAILFSLIPALGKVLITIRARPPALTLATGTYRHRAAGQSSEHTLGVSAAAPNGIFSGVGRGEWYSIVTGGEVTTNGDETVTQAQLMTVLAGRHRYGLERVSTFDQNDDAAAALLVGESYRGRIVWRDNGAGGAEFVDLKGIKDGSGDPPPPPVPAGAILGVDFGVQFQPGGFSIINDGDIIRGPWYDRFDLRVDPGNPLAFLVGIGQDIGGGAWRFRPSPTSVAVPASTTDTRLWLTSAGNLLIQDDAPSTNARMLADEVTTDLTDLISWQARANFPSGELVNYRLKADLSGPLVGEELDFFYVPQDFHIQSIRAELFRGGAPVGGSTNIDVERNLSTLWPTNGTPIAWDDAAVPPLVLTVLPELAEVPGMSRLGMRLISLVTGGDPERITLCITGFSPG